MEEKRTGEKERRGNLGRGLAALFGDTGPASDVPGADTQRGLRGVPLEHVHPNPQQPRHRFDTEDLKELADSIRENGIIQPIIVRHHPSLEGEYEIIAGERRWRAAQLLGLESIPAIVRRRDYDTITRFVRQMVENVQREDLNDVDRAAALIRLRDLMQEELEAEAELLEEPE